LLNQVTIIHMFLLQIFCGNGLCTELAHLSRLSFRVAIKGHGQWPSYIFNHAISQNEQYGFKPRNILLFTNILQKQPLQFLFESKSNHGTIRGLSLLERSRIGVLRLEPACIINHFLKRCCLPAVSLDPSQ
jgi:hypothetical protein